MSVLKALRPKSLHRSVTAELTILGGLHDDDIRARSVAGGRVRQHPDAVRRPLMQSPHRVLQLVGRHARHAAVPGASVGLGVQHAVAGQNAVPLVRRRRRPRHVDAVRVHRLTAHRRRSRARRCTMTGQYNY